MSNWWLPPYMGSWEQFMAALLHNPFLGSEGGGIPPSTHPEAMMSSPGTARLGLPGLGLEPSPSPWMSAVSSLIAVISLREVASKMPDGQVKIELSKRVDSAISSFIDDCGTKHPGWPWPGPPPWVIQSRRNWLSRRTPSPRAMSGMRSSRWLVRSSNVHPARSGEGK